MRSSFAGVWILLMVLLLVNNAHGFTIHQQQLSSLGKVVRKHALVAKGSPSSSSSLRLFVAEPLSSIELAQELSLQNQDVWVFVAGIIPFAWATVEFWSRIAVGKPFGTGSDSVYIGKDNAPKESRGRQVLDKGAFTVAYLLFGIAAGAIGLTLYSVVTSAPPESL